MIFSTHLLKKNFLVVSRRALGGTLRRIFQKWTFSLISKFNLKIVTRKELLANRTKDRVFQFADRETIILDKPSHSSDDIKAIASTIGTYILNESFVHEAADAELIGSIAVGFDREGSIISETITGNPDCRKYIPAQTLISQKLPNSGVSHLDTVCSLVNWNSGYFHWIADSLIRFEGLAHYEAQTGIKPTLIINPNPAKWKQESLRLLGYNPDDCIQWNGGRIKAKRLVVPSFRREYNIISPQACRWLRQRMSSNLPAVSSNLAFSPRIYISRPKTTGRHVINEDDVLKLLTPLGFVAYTMEELSVADQVRLFSQAEFIVAPHGAGLTNIIFAQKLSLIELFGSFGNPCFFALAQALGFRYGCLGVDFDPKNKSGKYQGMMVNFMKLQALVEEMLSVSGATKLQEVLPTKQK